MTLTTSESARMLERAEVEDVIFRVAYSAFIYYPTKPDEEVGYTVEEDIDWCMEPLVDKPGVDADTLAAGIRHLITDPTADRRAFILDLESRSE
jgi:hypothetical protein